MLDRVLVSNNPNAFPTLLLDPSDIKAAAIKHFQNIVDLSCSPFSNLRDLFPCWNACYQSLSYFEDDIYTSILASILFVKLHCCISDLYTNKAAGPSTIPYKWFKLLSDTGLKFFLKLLNFCFEHTDVSDDCVLL